VPPARPETVCDVDVNEALSYTRELKVELDET
jgi:hypothetical protein